MRSILSTMRYAWHRFWRNYYFELYDSCLDEQMKQNYWNKAVYHEKRLNI